MKKTLYLTMLFCVMLAASAQATTHTITVANYQFTPSSVTSQVGDTILWTWINGDHTTTSTTIPAGAAPWDQPISSTYTSFSYELTQPGTYSYHCTPHAPNMAGSITVQAATAVQEQTIVNTLPLYPNPATSTLYLDLSAMSGAVSITITDASGRMLRAMKATGGRTATIVTSGMPAGIYTVRAVGSDKQLSAIVSIR